VTGSPEPPEPTRPTEPAPSAEPTEEQIAERARQADKATRRALAGVLGLEAIVVLLVPRAIAFTDSGLGATKTVLLVVLAVLMIVAAAGVRRTWGIGAGSVLQVLFLLTGLWLAAMFFVGAVFGAIYLYLLSLRHELVGTPGGARMLVS
jgi:fatty acid desaturase